MHFSTIPVNSTVSSLTEIIWILFLDVVRSKDARIRILEEELKAADNEKLTLMHEKETAVKEVQNDFIIIRKDCIQLEYQNLVLHLQSDICSHPNIEF